MTHSQLRFALAPPDGVKSAWGARTIYHEIENDPSGSALRIVWDRQDAIGDARHDLCERLNANDNRIMRSAADRARDLMRTGELRADANERVVLFDDGTLRIEASPRRSGGYLYVCAYFVSELR